MIYKLDKWIETHKDDDTILIHFFKLIYLIGNITFIHPILAAALGTFTPILYTNSHPIIGTFFLFILILDIILEYICNRYSTKRYIERKLSSQIIQEHSILINSMYINIQNNSNWKSNIFKKTSELVCEKIHNDFKELLNCDTRVSIEYTFEKVINNKTQEFVKMSGRRSNQRAECKKSVPLDKRNKYYSYKIFINNSQGINILNKQQIENDSVWYNNPKHANKITKYIGIAVGAKEDKIDFILQIDFMNDIIFGIDNNNEDVEAFVNQYLMVYINTLSLSYILNLNKNYKIPEV